MACNIKFWVDCDPLPCLGPRLCTCELRGPARSHGFPHGDRDRFSGMESRFLILDEIMFEVGLNYGVVGGPKRLRVDPGT